MNGMYSQSTIAQLSNLCWLCAAKEDHLRLLFVVSLKTTSRDLVQRELATIGRALYELKSQRELATIGRALCELKSQRELATIGRALCELIHKQS